MSDAFVENLSDWLVTVGVIVGVLAWWFAREDANRKTDALERYKADSVKEMTSLNLALEKQKEETAKAQLELTRALAPRSFSQVGGSATMALAKFAGVEVRISHLPDLECARTAAQIQSLVISAKWISPDPQFMGAMVMPFDGVMVYAKMFGDMTPGDTQAHNAAKALVRELNKGGIKAGLGNPGHGAKSGLITVFVLEKPNPIHDASMNAFMEKVKSETGVDVEEQIRRGDELSTTDDPEALLKEWKEQDKAKAKQNP